MVDFGFSRIHGAFLVEEMFNRDNEDENDDDTKKDHKKSPAYETYIVSEQ